MRREATKVNARRKKVMQYIQANGQAKVEELSQALDTSEITIRRDLKHWEEKGAVERFYGGARLVQPFVETDGMDNEAHKHAIAKYAAQFIESGDTIFINTSSTALLILRYIHNKHITVITNNAKAIEIDHDPGISVVLTGGELRFPKESMVGEFALSNLHRVSADKVFLGCSGFSLQNGMSTAILNEVSINETMLQRCKGEIFILADSTKINKTHRFLINSPRHYDYLITDNRVLPHELEAFNDVGIKTVALAPYYSYATYQFGGSIRR